MFKQFIKIFFIVLPISLTFCTFPNVGICQKSVVTSSKDEIQLTKEEKNWLAQNHVVRARVGKAPPLHFLDGVNQGISVDYLDLIANRIGFKVEYVNDVSWTDGLENIKNHQVIDLILTAKNVKERRDFMLFTDEYLFMSWVIFTRTKSQFVSSLDDLTGKTIAIERNFFIHKKLAAEFPDIHLNIKETSLEALQAVATGEADAHIGNLTIATYIIQKNNLTNLRVSCPTPFENHNQSFAIRNDWPELVSIINKVLQTITPQENVKIHGNWFSVKYEYGINKTAVVKWTIIIIGFGGILQIFFIFWNRKLRYEIRERKKAEKVSRKATHDLGERIKELDCLYGISGLVENRAALERILQDATDFIPSSWQYPEITCAQIKLNDQTYKTDNFRETEWLQSQEIVVSGESIGVVEIHYLEKKEKIDEGPFLKEERGLIKAIAEQLGRIIEYKHAEIELRETKKEAESANQAKSDFLASMSHELRTPLNVILGFNRMMSKTKELPEAYYEQANIIKSSGEQLLDLINNLLDFSKIEAGYVSMEENDFDFYSLLDELHFMFQPLIVEKGLDLQITCSSDVPRVVLTDQTKLRQVLINLLTNAFKFTETGSVSLIINTVGDKSSSPQTFIQFKVVDTGPGINSDEVSQLFKAFAQTESGRNSQQGTGLGLAISQQFVKLMGGVITVSSKPGSGATFSFNISVRVPVGSATGEYASYSPTESLEHNKENRELVQKKQLASIAALPATIISELKEAATYCEVDGISQIITEIRKQDDDLADTLENFLKKFDFDGILAFLG